MGIRKRVRLGFFALGLLLLIAAVISHFEYAALNRTVRGIIDRGATSVAMSRSILDVMASQDALVLKYMNNLDSAALFTANTTFMEDINSVMEQVQLSYPTSPMVDQLKSSKRDYENVIEEFRAGSKEDNITWYLTTYKQGYSRYVNAIKEFMTDIQQESVREIEQFDRAAYRSVMQGVISIGVAMLLLLVLFFLIDIYFIKPVVRMSKGLKNYLGHNIPFNVTVEGRDEIFQLKEHIEQLLKNIRSLKGRP